MSNVQYCHAGDCQNIGSVNICDAHFCENCKGDALARAVTQKNIILYRMGRRVKAMFKEHPSSGEFYGVGDTMYEAIGRLITDSFSPSKTVPLTIVGVEWKNSFTDNINKTT